MYQTKIFDQDGKRRFLAGSGYVEISTKKIPVTEFLIVCCDCVLFSMAKSSVRVFVSVARTF